MKKLILFFFILLIGGCGTSYLPVETDTQTATIIYKGLTYTKVKLVNNKKIIYLEDTYPNNNIGDTIKWIDVEFETENQ